MLRRWLPERRDRSAAVRETGSAPTHSLVPENEPALDLIPGLDAADGLRRLLGRREAYMSLLRRFATGQAGVMRDIRAALADGRRADAERGAHTLKGIAGSIGARQLQREAGDVEAALRRGGTPEEVAPLLDPAERTLGELITALLRTLPAESEPTPVAAATVEPEALAAAVAKLEQLLEREAVEAIDAFEAARPILAAAFGDRSGQVGNSYEATASRTPWPRSGKWPAADQLRLEGLRRSFPRAEERDPSGTRQSRCRRTAWRARRGLRHGRQE